MKLRISYTLVAPGWNTGAANSTLQYTGHGCLLQIRPSETADRWVVLVEGPVDPSGLRLATENLPLTAEATPARMLVVPEAASFHGFAVDVTNALGFLYGRTFSLLSNLSKTLVPEDPADAAVLASFNTTEAYTTIGVRFETLRTVADVPPSQQLMIALLKKSAGLRLYAGAIGPIARYRDLWLILESAFGVDGERLVRRLAEYPPVVKHGPSPEVLHRLLVIRGRVSHAATKAPAREFIEIEELVSQHLDTLLTLADRVILTKKTWGTPTCGVEALPIPSAHWAERLIDY